MRTRSIHAVGSLVLGVCLALVVAKAADQGADDYRALASSAGASFTDFLLATNPMVPPGVSAKVNPSTNVLPPAARTMPLLSTVSGELNPRTNVVRGSSARMESLNDKQKLAVGDRVTFRVVEDQEEPKPLTVTDAGELDVPELGLVKADGKACKELAFEIKAKLEQTTYYHATVIINIDVFNKGTSGRRVYVAGEVPHPGQQEIPAGETWTVSKAIMRAGGFTGYADKKRVRVVRSGPKGTAGKTFIVNVAEVWEKGRTDLDVAVEPEDLICVLGRGVVFY